jgi:mannose/fructose/N-acetylgalactosamine-specific phosphotransferase system component IID
MASYALGVSIRLEEAFAAGQRDACEKLDRLKNLLVSILGAVGDNLFWFTIKPFSLLIGVSSLFLLKTNGFAGLALLGTFLIYNIPHIYLRYHGIIEGYKHGLEIYKCFSTQRFKKLRLAYIRVGLFAFILFLVVLMIKLSTAGFLYLAVMAGALVLSGICYHFTRNFYFTVAFTLILSIIAGILFN